MSSLTLKATFVVLLVGSMSQFALGAGSHAAPPISGATIDVTNGSPTCHVNDANDKVALSGNAIDNDQTGGCCPCVAGNRINLDATQWECTSGQLDSPTGATNSWKAGPNIGQYSVTATFHDQNDGAACDDDQVTKTITVTAFKVGIHLGTSGGGSFTRWEDSSGGTIGIGGSLSLNKVLTSNPNPPPGHADSAATWTLKTSPAGTLMKQYIHAKAHAWGGYLPSTPINRLDAVVSDSDWFDSGTANVSFGVQYGLVFIGTTILLPDNDNGSACAAGVGFGSQLHVDYVSCKAELVSQTTTGPRHSEMIEHSPADAWLIGGAGTSKQAEWEMQYKLEKKTIEPNWAAAEVSMYVNYAWGVTDTLPYYGP